MPNVPPSRVSRRLRSAASASTACAIVLVGFGALPATAAEGDVAIDVYTMNDFHGRIETTSTSAGAAGVAGAYKGFFDQNPNSTLVSAGDNVGASTFVSFVQDDEPTIDALNATGLTATAIGNHELDKGRADLDEHIIDRADYAHISANLFEKGTTDYAYAPYDLQVFDGVTVGFVGAVTEDLPYLVSPAGIATLDVAPIISSVNTVATELKDGDPANGEADVVILLIHEGAPTATTSVTDTSTVFGRIVTGTAANLDAIASGHTHQAYASTATVGDRTIPVLQTGSYGTNLGRIALEVDPVTKEISSATGTLVPLLTAGGALVYPADPEVQALVDDAVAQAAVEGAQPVGTIGADFTRARQTDGTENRGGESAISNLIAEAQLAATSELGAQIAFLNPGGVRNDLLYASSGSTNDADGVVTYQEAAVVQPFANTLVTETLTGAQIKAVLEQQWQPAGTSRPFLKLGTNIDFAYTYDPTAAAGNRILTMTYQGAPVTPEQSFTIVTNNFLAAGGDNFTAFAAGSDIADSGRSDLQAFVDYLGATENVLFPVGATRSVGVADGAALQASLAAAAPGQEFIVDLSSLIIPGTPLQPADVDVYFDDDLIGLAAVDPAVVDTTDEIGRARVRFELPADAAEGAHVLSFRLAETGVEIDYPVTIAAAAVVPPVATDPAGTPVVPAVRPGTTRPVVPSRVLAATGVELGTTIGSGVLLLLAGLAMVATRRLRRQEG
jgi:5'-nucleotidase